MCRLPYVVHGRSCHSSSLFPDVGLSVMGPVYEMYRGETVNVQCLLRYPITRNSNGVTALNMNEQLGHLVRVVSEVAHVFVWGSDRLNTSRLQAANDFKFLGDQSQACPTDGWMDGEFCCPNEVDLTGRRRSAGEVG